MPIKQTKLTGKFNFSYVARDYKNRRVKGEILAENKSTAQSDLKKMGYHDIKLILIGEPNFLIKMFSKRRVSPADITSFTRQMATMQNAGIPLVQALKVIIESTSKKDVKKLVNKLKDEVESGGSFSECLRYHPQDFDDLYCSLIEAGESSGNLDLMLQRIATYREKTEVLKHKLKKAMYYPVAVLSVAFIVTAILLVKVVPTFKAMFEGFGSELPAYTVFILNLSDNVQKNGLKFVAAIVFLSWLAGRMYRNNDKFRNIVQRMLLKFPVFGKIMHKAAVARFARTLSTTFAAGVPLPDALTLVARASGNIMYHNAIIKMRDGVSVGQRINASMQESHVFPNMVVQMVSIGEETGALDAMLSKVADIYEQEVDLAVDGLSTLLEPFIMVILGVIVGGLVIAMYLPIFKLGSVF